MAKPSIYTQEMIEKYTGAGYWGPMTVSDYWERNARDYPHKEAVVDSRTRLTWAQAKVWIDRLALGLLELGLKKDDLIVLQLPNAVELALLRVACERAGLLFLPALRTLRHTEMGHILRTTGAVGIVIPWKFRDFDYLAMIEELRPQSPSLRHIFVVGDKIPEGTISIKEMVQRPLETKYPPDYLEGKKCPPLEFSMVGLTTGTTGMPKFVEVTTCSRLWSGRVTSRDMKMDGHDIVGVLSPTSLGPNVAAYFGAPQFVAKVVILENWTPEEALKLIEREKVTIPCVVPTHLAEIAAYPGLAKFDLSSIRVFNCTGAALPYPVGVEIERKLGKPILQSYGSTDFGGTAEVSLDDPQDVRLLTVGHPFPGNEVKLVDGSGHEVPRGGIGEILIRGASSAGGYYKDPDATARAWDKEGWYRTGDLGKWDERGYLTIVGREKDMIIRGGQNIYPAEVENLLLTHPKVHSAAIVSIPDSIMGEKACACVVIKSGQGFTLEEMVSFLKTKRIAAYKLPEKLVLLDSLPYVGGLKLDRKALRAEAVQRLKAMGEIPEESSKGS